MHVLNFNHSSQAAGRFNADNPVKFGLVIPSWFVLLLVGFELGNP